MTLSPGSGGNVAPEPPRVYLDTCVFVNVFTAGRHDPEFRLSRSNAVITKSDMGEFQLVESTLVIAETLGAPNMRGDHISKKLRYQALTQGRRFFAQRHSSIRWVELDRRLAERASQFATDLQLTGPDAVHLASAVQAGCSKLMSWDHDLLKIKACEGVAIVEPDVDGQLPLSTEEPN